MRTRVGRNDPLPQKLWLADVASGKVSELKFDALPGIATDPLAALRKAAGKEPLKGNRAVQVATSGDNGDAPALLWSGDSRNVAVMVRAIDNKDRWIASVDLANATLQSRHRLTDPAWINWGFNEFGWLADGSTLWYLSEESGYSHLYTLNGTNKAQPVSYTHLDVYKRQQQHRYRDLQAAPCAAFVRVLRCVTRADAPTFAFDAMPQRPLPPQHQQQHGNGDAHRQRRQQARRHAQRLQRPCGQQASQHEADGPQHSQRQCITCLLYTSRCV